MMFYHMLCLFEMHKMDFLTYFCPLVQDFALRVISHKPRSPDPRKTYECR
jgi:hypothetical protein